MHIKINIFDVWINYFDNTELFRTYAYQNPSNKSFTCTVAAEKTFSPNYIYLRAATLSAALSIWDPRLPQPVMSLRSISLVCEK